MVGKPGFDRGGAVGFQEDAGQGHDVPLKSLFSPEFLDRLDEVIVFDTFERGDIVVIARQALEDIRRELASRGIDVTFAQEVAEFLVDKLPPGESVRPLRGVIREFIEDPLSLEILAHGSQEPLLVTIEDGKPVFARPVPLV